MNKCLINKGIALFFFICFVLSCKSNHNKALEQTIFSELIGKLVDSTISDYRRLVVPSLDDFDNEESKKGLYERIEIKKNKELDPLVVFIHDTIGKINNGKEFFSKIKPHLEKNNFESILLESKKSVNKIYIDHKLFKVDNTKYKLLSLIKKREEKYKTRTDLATYSFSRIYFNKEKTLGLFSLNIVYSGLNGYGFIVVVSKIDGDWEIEKLVEYWES
ncbi:hypothetical protein [Algibacter sp. R77976]|uniref:hypothetical protein n=1 Tax=Algibacter sp. R77976 TaxID=3093873 RepID=UPI0037CA26CA